MDIMALPTQEVIDFCKEVIPWIKEGEERDGKMFYVFKEETPKKILELFEKIKYEVSKDWLYPIA